MKRVMLFLATNFAVVIVLMVITSLLGVNQYIEQQGINYEALLIFASVFGFGGAFIGPPCEWFNAPAGRRFGDSWSIHLL